MVLTTRWLWNHIILHELLCGGWYDTYEILQSLNRDTALATAAVYQAMFGMADGTIPATFQVNNLASNFGLSISNLET